MASNDDKSKSTSADGTPEGGKKPTGPTIDLKATEVKGDDGKSGSKAPDDKVGGAAKTAAGASGSARDAGTKGQMSSSGGKSAGATPSAGSTQATSTKTPDTSSGGGIGAPLAAVFGGAIGAALVFALLQLTGMIGAGGRTDLADEVASLRQEVEGIGSRLAEVSEGSEVSAVDLGPIEAEIADIRAAVDAAQSAVADAAEGGDAGEAVSTLTERLATLESAQEQAQAAVTSLRDELVTGGDGSEAAALLSAIEDRIAAVEQQAGSVAESIGTVDDRIGAAVAAIPEVDVSALETTQMEVAARIDTLSSRVDAVSSDIAALGDRVGAVESDVTALKEAEGEVDNERRSAFLVALSGLQNAAASSGPFAVELDAVTALAGDGESFAALAPFAETGVPSTSRLARDFRSLAGPILDASARESADGALARLAAGAQSLVRIRPTGYVAGDSPAASVARIESLMEERKVEAALAEWDNLPAAGKAVSADWADKARQRVALDAALSGSATN